MKKVLIKILACALGLCLLCSTLAGCDSCNQSKWDATEMNNWGDVKSVGGFIAETENYLYFINGIANTSGDNSYGAPVKGALMVADRNNLQKSEIAVPKLFGASDYGAGLFIYDGYVYYGTPSTDKAPDGTVAKSEMMFRRAKLDGSKDELIFSVSALSLEYRMLEKDGNVYIVYYDKENTSLVSYNTSNNESVVIAKTDEQTEGKESLASYVFLNNGASDTAVLVYATTVYSLPYNEEMNEGIESTRPTEAYNKVYAYSVGDTKQDGQEVVGKLVYDGSVEENTYTILNDDAKYVYIQKTEEFGKVTTYAVTVEELLAKEKSADAGVEVLAEYAKATGNLIVDLDNVYVIPATDSSSTETTSVKLYRDTMKVNGESGKIDHAETKELVAICQSIHALLFVHNDYVYYYNSNLEICRVNLAKGEDAVEERVSDGAATGLSTWYAPEIITINEKDYLFYCDNSDLGLSYVKYIDLATVVTEEDTNDDDKNDLFYLEGARFMGKILDSDKASMMQTKINNIANELDDGALVFDADEDGNYIKDANGKIKVSAVEKVRAEYNELSASVKEDVNTDTLEKYERAIEIANLLYKLEGIEKFSSNDKENEELAPFKTAYESIKAEMEEYYESGEYNDIGAYIENDLKANYTKAYTLFEDAE